MVRRPAAGRPACTPALKHKDQDPNSGEKGALSLIGQKDLLVYLVHAGPLPNSTERFEIFILAPVEELRRRGASPFHSEK